MSSLTDCPARCIHNVSWVANQQPFVATTTSPPQGHRLALTLHLLWLILDLWLLSWSLKSVKVYRGAESLLLYSTLSRVSGEPLGTPNSNLSAFLLTCGSLTVKRSMTFCATLTSFLGHKCFLKCQYVNLFSHLKSEDIYDLCAFFSQKIFKANI